MNRKIIFIVMLVAVTSAICASLFTSTLKDRSFKSSVISVARDVPAIFASNDTSNEGYPDLTFAAEKTVPVVVGIEKIITTQANSNQYYGGNIDPFLELFGFRSQGSSRGQQYEPQEQRSGGSGVLISSDGYIVTNNHVIENASKLSVTLSDGKKYAANLIGTDPTTDIALVKIEATGLPFITFGSSERLRLGEWLLAVGNPYGLNSTVTAGIVSAKGRNLDVIPSQFRVESFIQTDAAVNPGNSGGALVNTKGELVGINTVIKSPTGSFAGYSFAVPSSIVKKVIVDLMEFGIVQRGLMGVEYSEITDDFIEKYGKELSLKEGVGLYIGNVLADGAAAAAGIEKGDVIISIDDTSITSSSALQEEIAKHRPGDKIKISVKRDGKVKHFDVVLRNKAGEEKLLEKDVENLAAFLGGEFADINARTKKSLEINHGVQVINVGNGLLAKVGVKTGYIITHINGKEISDISNLNQYTDKIEIIDGLYPNGRYISYSIFNN
ncbi:MAG: trypsin-like peptidase domain-containing protein [Rikenellaceae bacterium]